MRSEGQSETAGDASPRIITGPRGRFAVTQGAREGRCFRLSISASFAFGAGIIVRRGSAENVRLILMTPKRHAQKLSRQLSDTLKSLPARTQKSPRALPLHDRESRDQSNRRLAKRGTRPAVAVSGGGGKKRLGRNQGAGSSSRQ